MTLESLMLPVKSKGSIKNLSSANDNSCHLSQQSKHQHLYKDMPLKLRTESPDVSNSNDLNI